MEQTGLWEPGKELTMSQLKKMLKDCFHCVDFEVAKKDVLPFVADSSKLDLWNAVFSVQLRKNGGDFF